MSNIFGVLNVVRWTCLSSRVLWPNLILMCFFLWFCHVIRDFPIEFSSEFSIFCDFTFFHVSLVNDNFLLFCTDYKCVSKVLITSVFLLSTDSKCVSWVMITSVLVEWCYKCVSWVLIKSVQVKWWLQVCYLSADTSVQVKFW